MVDLPGTAGQQLPVHHGTTTLAFVIDEGIICAVDSRASLGSLVGSRTTDKVLPVTSRVLGTMAGGAADCGYWIRVLSARVRLWELEEGRPASVRMVAHLLVEMLRGQRGLSVGTMIMGHSCGGDEEDAGEDGPGGGESRDFSTSTRAEPAWKGRCSPSDRAVSGPSVSSMQSDVLIWAGTRPQI